MLSSVYLYTASPSLLSIMRRAAWGGGKPRHISVFLGYAYETTVTGRRQPDHIHYDRYFFPYKYFAPDWSLTRMEEVCSSVVKYSTSTDWAIPAPSINVLLYSHALSNEGDAVIIEVVVLEPMPHQTDCWVDGFTAHIKWKLRKK